MNKRTILKEGKLAGLINDELYIAIESQGLNKTKDLYFRSLNEAKDVKSLKWRKANEDERMQYSKHLLKENMKRYKRVDRLLKHYNIMYNGHGIETVEKSTVDHPYYQNIDYFYVNMGDPHIETFIYDVTNDKFIERSLADFIEQREQNINQMDMTNESKKVLKSLLKENMDKYDEIYLDLVYYYEIYGGYGVKESRDESLNDPVFGNVDYMYVDKRNPHRKTHIYDVRNDKMLNMTLTNFLKKREKNINHMDMTNESKKVLKNFIKKVIVEAKSSGENEIEYKGHTIYRYPNWYSSKIDGTTKKADTAQALKKQIDEYIKNSKKKK